MRVTDFFATVLQRHRKHGLISGFILVLTASIILPASAQTLVWLGTLHGGMSRADGISADGKIVVGSSYLSFFGEHAFIWTQRDGMRELGTRDGFIGSRASALSDNGNVAAGVMVNPSGVTSASYWWISVGSGLLGGLGGAWSWAEDVSANGSVIVGTAENSSSLPRAFRYTLSGYLSDLGTLGGPRSYADAVSADGRVIVGQSQTADGSYQAFLWKSSTGMENLSLRFPWISIRSAATGISPGGDFIVGFAEDTSGEPHSYRWSQDEGVVELGRLGWEIVFPMDVSTDGRVVVGQTQSFRAFRWTPETGVQDLNAAFAHLLPPGYQLEVATAVTPDGRYIVGRGMTPLFLPEAFILDTCPGGDNDGDAICDDWERYGIDINLDGIIDLDLRALGARDNRKDIFVEYDAMTGFAPSQAAIDRVVAAFNSHQIALHVQNGGHLDIPVINWPNPWVGFDSVKEVKFGTPQEQRSENWRFIRMAKRKVFRYCVFAKQYGVDDPATRDRDESGSSGIAELPGDDFIVTLGHANWVSRKAEIERMSRDGERWDGVQVSWDDFVAGTFLHELGHTLGLRHGGGSHRNHKPNYHSVMNYLWQLPAKAYASGWTLDYSGSVFRNLNEGDLSEPDGIGGHAGHRVPIGGTQGRLVDEQGAVDWNGDGDSDDVGVRFDANGDGAISRLDGYNDWNNLDLSHGPNWADGVHIVLAGDDADLEEMTHSDWLQLARIGSPGDVDLNGCTDDADLLAVLFAFGQVGPELEEDLNWDGMVDDADLLIVLFEFGSGC